MAPLSTLGDVWPGARLSRPATPAEPAAPAEPPRCARTGKVQHLRKVDAMGQLRSLLVVSPDEELHTFSCPFCHRWHVGHAVRGK